jgi:hypothetical protein
MTIEVSPATVLREAVVIGGMMALPMGGILQGDF